MNFQASCLHLDAVDERLVRAVIESVSDDGYFVGDLGMVAYACGVAFEDAQRALGIVQGMQPAGVGARTLSECLALQVDANCPLRDALLELIEGHLSDLAENRLASLARALDVDMEGMLSLKREVLAMNPRPGSAFWQRPDARYVTPDLVVRKNDAQLAVEVVGSCAHCLSLNAEYVAMLEAGGLMAEARDYLAAKREEADRLLRNLDHRTQTLQRFGAFLVERQFRFFSCGGALAPMTMQQAADALDVHVSTISRTAQGKYIQTPRGTFALKSFFTRALPQSGAAAGGGISSFDIKRMIREFIEAEDAASPLSDAAITEMLNARGVEIKRRTVAKYREALGIDPQSKRRWAHAGG